MPEKTVAGKLGRVGQLIAGILVIVAIIIILQNMLGYVQVQSAPAGWQIIRPPPEVSTLIIVDDIVWTGGKEGLILINRMTGTRIATPASAPSFGYVRQILRDSNGWIWVAHDGGLARFRNESWEVIAPAPGMPFSKALSIAERQDGTIIIGTDTDILSYQDSTWRSMLTQDSPSIACAEVLLEDHGANLWVGCGLPTRGGLYRLNGTSWSSFTLKDGLPHQSVRGIAQTRDGTVWVATGFASHGGAARYSGSGWTNLTKSDGLAGDCTRSVYEDDAGRLWIGSEYDGIAVGTPGSWKVLSEKDGLAGYEVKVMTQDVDGTYWLGTESGLNRIRLDAVFPKGGD